MTGIVLEVDGGRTTKIKDLPHRHYAPRPEYCRSPESAPRYLRETPRIRGLPPDAHFGAPPISTRWSLAMDPKYAVIATRSGLPSSGGVPAKPPLMQDQRLAF